LLRAKSNVVVSVLSPPLFSDVIGIPLRHLQKRLAADSQGMWNVNRKTAHSRDHKRAKFQRSQQRSKVDTYLLVLLPSITFAIADLFSAFHFTPLPHSLSILVCV